MSFSLVGNSVMITLRIGQGWTGSSRAAREPDVPMTTANPKATRIRFTSECLQVPSRSQERIPSAPRRTGGGPQQLLAGGGFADLRFFQKWKQMAGKVFSRMSMSSARVLCST